MAKYFVDGNGIYIGGFEGAEPSGGATEVPEAPDDARQVWADRKMRVDTGNNGPDAVGLVQTLRLNPAAILSP